MSKDEKKLGRILIEIGEVRDISIPEKLEKGVGPLLKVIIGGSTHELLPKDTKIVGSTAVVSYNWKGRLETGSDYKVQFVLIEVASGKALGKVTVRYKKLHRGENQGEWRSFDTMGRVHVALTPLSFGKIDKPMTSHDPERSLFGRVAAHANPFRRKDRASVMLNKARELKEYKANQINRQLPHVASGASGVVYKGYVKDHDELVAIKDMPVTSLDIFAEWKNEVEFMAQHPHPYIVEIHGFCATDDALTIVMEFCQNGTLYDMIHENKTVIPFVHRIKMARQCAYALAFLHEQNIMHRDVKSLNFLISKDNVCKLADFGTAKTASAQFNTERRGTPLWMAPEVKSSKTYTLSADLFSLGVVLYELFTLSLPDYDDVTEDVLFQPHSYLGGIIVESCVNKSPSKRPPSVAVAQFLEQILIYIINGALNESLVPKDLAELDGKHGPSSEALVQQRFSEALAIITDVDRMVALGAKAPLGDVKGTVGVGANISEETERNRSMSGTALSPDDITKTRSSSTGSNTSTGSSQSPWKPNLSPRQGERNVEASSYRKSVDLSSSASLKIDAPSRPSHPSPRFAPSGETPSLPSRSSSAQLPQVQVSEHFDAPPLSQSTATIVPRGVRVLPRSQTDGHIRRTSDEQDVNQSSGSLGRSAAQFASPPFVISLPLELSQPSLAEVPSAGALSPTHSPTVVHNEPASAPYQLSSSTAQSPPMYKLPSQSATSASTGAGSSASASQSSYSTPTPVTSSNSPTASTLPYSAPSTNQQPYTAPTSAQGYPPPTCTQPYSTTAPAQPYSAPTSPQPYSAPSSAQPYSASPSNATYSTPSMAQAYSAPSSAPSSAQSYSAPSSPQPYSAPSATQPYSAPSSQPSYSSYPSQPSFNLPPTHISGGSDPGPSTNSTPFRPEFRSEPPPSQYTPSSTPSLYQAPQSFTPPTHPASSSPYTNTPPGTTYGNPAPSYLTGSALPGAHPSPQLYPGASFVSQAPAMSATPYGGPGFTLHSHHSQNSPYAQPQPQSQPQPAPFSMAPPPQQFQQTIGRVRMVYAFTAMNNGELNVNAGDILDVLKYQGVWVHGRTMDGRVGFVPQNYTQPC